MKKNKTKKLSLHRITLNNLAAIKGGEIFTGATVAVLSKYCTTVTVQISQCAACGDTKKESCIGGYCAQTVNTCQQSVQVVCNATILTSRP
jgi:hypothetical protein